MSSGHTLKLDLDNLKSPSNQTALAGDSTAHTTTVVSRQNQKKAGKLGKNGKERSSWG